MLFRLKNIVLNQACKNHANSMVTVQDFFLVKYMSFLKDGESYVVFNINMAGRHLCSRRYREFVEIHSALKTEFLGKY